MIKLTKSSNVIRLIVCTLTALFVSLSFMGCPMPVGPDLPDVDITDDDTGTGSTTDSDVKDFYVFVAGFGGSNESSVVTKSKNYTDAQKNGYATSVSYTGIDGLDNLKTHIKQEIMKPGNCGREEGKFITPAMTEEMFDRELQSLWTSIDANYRDYNYIDIVWYEEHYGRNYEIEILNIKM